MLSLTTASRKMKFWEMCPVNEVKDLYREKFKSLKTLRKASKWKDIPCSNVGEINTVKMTVPPKAVCRLSAFAIKLLSHSLHQEMTKNHMEPQTVFLFNSSDTCWWDSNMRGGLLCDFLPGGDLATDLRPHGRTRVRTWDSAAPKAFLLLPHRFVCSRRIPLKTQGSVRFTGQ